ncbi:MAG: MFS transporter [Lachnospiraceae bacterium]|nr:MFS transporter [Lachnospiraceae bacterium]
MKETPEKRKRQLERLYKEKRRKSYRGYFFIATFIIILTRITNELSTNLSIYVQSSVVSEFFVVNGRSYEEGLSIFSMMNMAASMIVIFAVFYKTLADRLGRKTVLVFNAIGLAMGMVLCYFSASAAMYIAGIAFTNFFVQNDMQMVYILETAPEGRETTYFGFIKAVGILGLLLVPVLRDSVMNNEQTLWRNIYLIPAIICLVVAVCTTLFLRESEPFINQRIARLEKKAALGSSSREKVQCADKKTDIKQPESEINGEEEKSADTSLGKAIRYVMQNKETRWIVLTYLFFGVCSMAAYSYVESVMTTNGMSASDVTSALYIYPFVYAALTFIAGPLGDRFGRKAVIIPTGCLTVGGYLFFLMGCRSGWNPYLIGLLNGIYLGSYFIATEYTGLMLMEKVPTEIRASATSAATVLVMGGYILGLAQMMIIMTNIGLNAAVLSTIIPYMLIGTLIMIFKITETKGTKLSAMQEM